MSVLQDLENLILSPDKLTTDGVPSASIAILDDGKISAHVISKGAENVDSVYQACSISKAITALAVAKLVDEGRISYDTKVTDHLNQRTINCLVERKTAHLMQHVTVAMLLSHTSGLSQGGFPGYSGELPTYEDILTGRNPSNTPRIHFKAFPGAQCSYSGGGYLVLQMFLENATGTLFPHLMRKIVLKPLGMTRSWYGEIPPTENNYVNAHHTAYVEAGTRHHRFVELGAAGLWTTPTDLLKAISAIQDSLYTEAGFIKQHTATEMLKPVISHSLVADMALGWSVNDNFFAHAGSNYPGYCTYVFGFGGSTANDDTSVGGDRPRNGIAVMTNSAVGHEVAVKQIVSAMFYLKGWNRFEGLPSGFGKDDYVPYAAPEGSTVDKAWKQWIGEWDNDWQLADEDGPVLIFRSFPPMKLRVAAAPIKVTIHGRKEVMFVTDGLKTGLRLTWKDDVQVIELQQDESKTLKRT